MILILPHFVVLNKELDTYKHMAIPVIGDIYRNPSFNKVKKLIDFNQEGFDGK